jgi:hypothetical protein
MYFQEFENFLSESECKIIYEYINHNTKKSVEIEYIEGINGIFNSKMFLENIKNRLQNLTDLVLQSNGLFVYKFYFDKKMDLHKDYHEPNKKLTLLIYLNSDCETTFYIEDKIVSIKSNIGKGILFDENILYESNDNIYKKIILQCNFTYICFDNFKI